MDKKYKLTDETILHKSKTLYRIEALRDFNDVKKGDKGGFIECEDNLSQKGNCWIYDNAKVFESAHVRQHACVCNYAEVYGNAMLYEKAIVAGFAKVYDEASISGAAYIGGYACVYDSACILSRARVNNSAEVFDNATVYGDACVESFAYVYGNANIGGHAYIGGRARVYENSVVRDDVIIEDNSKIHGEVNITGNACITDAEISKMDDYIVFKNWWSSGRYFTWTKSNNMWRVGCFYGTGKQLIAKAYRDSELSGREYERIVRYVEAINQPAKRLNLIQRIVCKLFKIK